MARINKISISIDGNIKNDIGFMLDNNSMLHAFKNGTEDRAIIVNRLTWELIKGSIDDLFIAAEEEGY